MGAMQAIWEHMSIAFLLSKNTKSASLDSYSLGMEPLAIVANSPTLEAGLRDIYQGVTRMIDGCSSHLLVLSSEQV